MIPTVSFWRRWIDRVKPYLISPIGVPIRPGAITYFAADRPAEAISANRYPRQIIGVAIRLPDMDIRFRPHPAPEVTCHPVLSIIWGKPHGAGRWPR